ncbi:MAG: hypothetical protein P0Y56_01470 [Candidatus Andeanibacterium colombiense]|uniref:Tetratricopeptide repeat protein n=1 Tax=Candidatus Andeanibacterium colombiense TaxID=3121345 RepID=A0AAJ5X999_9SPHN|nr:MAG: hypothetical protein P0Y56_01470 [Sphingomonadaceae bacterium]
MRRVSMRAPRRKGFVSGLALALSFTAAGFTVPAQAQSEKPAYSKNFVKPAQQASTDVNAARSKPEVQAEIANLIAASNALSAAKGDAVAPAQAQFDAVAQRIQGMTTAERRELQDLAAKAETPDDKFMAGDLMGFLGAFSGDQALRAQGLKLKLDSGTLKPDLAAASWFELGQLSYATNRVDDARAAFEAAYKAGKIEAALYAADTFYSTNRVPEGLDYLEAQINARLAAGQEVPLEWYGNGLNKARGLNDPVRLGHWAGLYGAGGHTPQSWNAAIGVVMQTSKYGPAEQLDAYRLMKRTNSLLATGDYVRYIEAADARSMANEVLPALDEAVSKGLLSKTPGGSVTADLVTFTNSNYEIANKRGPEDRNTIGAIVADAQKGANGANARDAGDVYQSFGDNAKAEEMFKLALQKGGVDNDRILMRMAIAQADQGKYADAKASLAKITGARAPLAGLWIAYIDSKAGHA